MTKRKPFGKLVENKLQAERASNAPSLSSSQGSSSISAASSRSRVPTLDDGGFGFLTDKPLQDEQQLSAQSGQLTVSRRQNNEPIFSSEKTPRISNVTLPVPIHSSRIPTNSTHANDTTRPKRPSNTEVGDEDSDSSIISRTRKKRRRRGGTTKAATAPPPAQLQGHPVVAVTRKESGSQPSRNKSRRRLKNSKQEETRPPKPSLSSTPSLQTIEEEAGGESSSGSLTDKSPLKKLAATTTKKSKTKVQQEKTAARVPHVPHHKQTPVKSPSAFAAAGVKDEADNPDMDMDSDGDKRKFLIQDDLDTKKPPKLQTQAKTSVPDNHHDAARDPASDSADKTPAAPTRSGAIKSHSYPAGSKQHRDYLKRGVVLFDPNGRLSSGSKAPSKLRTTNDISSKTRRRLKEPMDAVASQKPSSAPQRDNAFVDDCRRKLNSRPPALPVDSIDTLLEEDEGEECSRHARADEMPVSVKLVVLSAAKSRRGTVIPDDDDMSSLTCQTLEETEKIPAAKKPKTSSVLTDETSAPRRSSLEKPEKTKGPSNRTRPLQLGKPVTKSAWPDRRLQNLGKPEKTGGSSNRTAPDVHLAKSCANTSSLDRRRPSLGKPKKTDSEDPLNRTAPAQAKSAMNRCHSSSGKSEQKMGPSSKSMPRQAGNLSTRASHSASCKQENKNSLPGKSAPPQRANVDATPISPPPVRRLSSFNKEEKKSLSNTLASKGVKKSAPSPVESEPRALQISNRTPACENSSTLAALKSLQTGISLSSPEQAKSISNPPPVAVKAENKRKSPSRTSQPKRKVDSIPVPPSATQPVQGSGLKYPCASLGDRTRQSNIAAPSLVARENDTRIGSESEWFVGHCASTLQNDHEGPSRKASDRVSRDRQSQKRASRDEVVDPTDQIDLSSHGSSEVASSTRGEILVSEKKQSPESATDNSRSEAADESDNDGHRGDNPAPHPLRFLPRNLWTAEMSGIVQLAPYIRLPSGETFLHPPLPAGWEVSVCRHQQRPYYWHPDHGRTYLPPVLLPSADGCIHGFTPQIVIETEGRISPPGMFDFRQDYEYNHRETVDVDGRSRSPSVDESSPLDDPPTVTTYDLSETTADDRDGETYSRLNYVQSPTKANAASPASTASELTVKSDEEENFPEESVHSGCDVEQVENTSSQAASEMVVSRFGSNQQKAEVAPLVAMPAEYQTDLQDLQEEVEGIGLCESPHSSPRNGPERLKQQGPRDEEENSCLAEQGATEHVEYEEQDGLTAAGSGNHLPERAEQEPLMSSEESVGPVFDEIDKDDRAQNDHEDAETNQSTYFDSPARLPESPQDELSEVSVSNESARDQPFFVSVPHEHARSDAREDVSLLGVDGISFVRVNQRNGSRAGSYKSRMSARCSNPSIRKCLLQIVPTLPYTKTTQKKKSANERKDPKKKQTKTTKCSSYRRRHIESQLVMCT